MRAISVGWPHLCLVSFEPDTVSVQLDGKQLRLELGRTVIPNGPDRDLTVTEALPRGKR
jgi:hypothetical protein